MNKNERLEALLKRLDKMNPERKKNRGYKTNKIEKGLVKVNDIDKIKKGDLLNSEFTKEICKSLNIEYLYVEFEEAIDENEKKSLLIDKKKFTEETINNYRTFTDVLRRLNKNLTTAQRTRHQLEAKQDLLNTIHFLDDSEFKNNLVTAVIKHLNKKIESGVYMFKGWVMDLKQINQSFKNDDIEFNTKATEKLIMLEKMGVIDFLKQNKDFTSSTNLMAKYISLITGEKTTTIQPSLNAIINNDIENKNNPLSRVKTVDKTLQKLASLGIETIK